MIKFMNNNIKSNTNNKPFKPNTFKSNTTGKPIARNKSAVGSSVYSKKKQIEKNKAKGRFDGFKNRKKDEFDQSVIDIARVTRVMAGGKRMRFRACVVIGNRKGKIAVGMDKGVDVTIAINKAVNQAKKNIINIPIVNDTIPHSIYYKKGAAKILFKPASSGKGIIAGGAVRVIMELSGIKNITSKILGTNNKVNIAKCVVEALNSLKKAEKQIDKQKENNKNTDKKIDIKK